MCQSHLLMCILKEKLTKTNINFNFTESNVRRFQVCLFFVLFFFFFVFFQLFIGFCLKCSLFQMPHLRFIGQISKLKILPINLRWKSRLHIFSIANKRTCYKFGIFTRKSSPAEIEMAPHHEIFINTKNDLMCALRTILFIFRSSRKKSFIVR